MISSQDYIEEIAPAKINLYLHVGGIRPDGLHDLASLFCFADVGDVIGVRQADTLSLSITGPFAHVLSAEPVERNLVWRAAEALAAAAGCAPAVQITLDKRLPIAAGIGGGSSDAAATLRALVRLWGLDISASQLARIAFELGADVPACLFRQPVLVRGAGEQISNVPALAPCAVCLINPLIETPTGRIFSAFDKDNPHPEPPLPFDGGAKSYDGLIQMMHETRNDLEPYAMALRPAVEHVRTFLSAQPGCSFARMSGSGASVFGLFSSFEAAKTSEIAARGSGWWASAARIYDSDGVNGLH